MLSLFPRRRGLPAAILFIASLLGVAPLAAGAQAAPAGAEYTGPRYPGGPDSLRAALRRLARVPGTPASGELLIQLQLGADGRPRDLTLLNAPPGPHAVRLTISQAQALDAALARWPAWQLPAQPPADSPATITLPLAFGPAAGPAALAYADAAPVFAPGSLGPDSRQPGGSPTLLAFVQRQIRYPADDLRARRQGRACGYFEVSETGAIEQRRIVGSLSPTIDAELLRVLQLLPDAQAPARYQGRPVRVFYVVPITLRLQ